MQLNENGKLARFYMWFTPVDKSLPPDFCTYFWGLIVRATLVLFLGWVAGSLSYWLIRLVLWLSRLMWAHPRQALIGLGGALLIALVVWLSAREKKIEIEVLSEAKAIVAGKIDAIKYRYCPCIEWIGSKHE
jgi:hypothetical protein